MTRSELAILRTAIYASLFDYPLTLDQLHESLLESNLTPSEILATYNGSPALQQVIEYREGFFFPAGRGELIGERRHREARSRAFLQSCSFVLRLICAVPYTRMVALSGSIAHLNLERGGDLDVFVITKGPRVWSVALMILLLTKLLRRRRIICANLVVADSRLALDQQDLFTANQIIHLKPLIGEEVLDDFLSANPFVRSLYPNALTHHPKRIFEWPRRDVLRRVKAALEVILLLPAPAIEAVARGLYRGYLRRRAATWQSPEQVRLDDDFLKLHTRSHRVSVIDRFERAVEEAWRRAGRATPRAAAR